MHASILLSERAYLHTLTGIDIYPHLGLPFMITATSSFSDTDTSDTGIGAVLSQIDSDGREQVITYGSCLYTVKG